MSTSKATAAAGTFDERDARALTQYMTVLEDVGMVRRAPDMYLVVSESGKEYIVDVQTDACQCADKSYRDIRCKHRRRVAYATGEQPIPHWADLDRIDPLLGRHVTGEPLVTQPGGTTIALAEAREQIDGGAE